MKHTNYEIKARSSEEQHEKTRDYLKKNNAEFKGTDHQIDTYFRVPEGRLKIREGNVENNLIYYNRPDSKGSKNSEIELYPLKKNSYLGKIVRDNYNILVEVDKKREIYFINNVKFHLDDVKGLGRFIEVEAISENGSLPKGKIKEQCEFYKHTLGIKDLDLIENSYSDMLLNKSYDKSGE